MAKYTIFGEKTLTEKNKQRLQQNVSSRRFWIVVLILAIIVTAMFLPQGMQFIPVLSILAGGITAWLGLTSYFREKNYKEPLE
jgi:hypothetical protein